MTRRNLILLFFLLSSSLAFAQPGDPNGGNPPGSVPITGIELLLVSGGILGIKRLFGKDKKNT